jgi:hypothetical protein
MLFFYLIALPFHLTMLALGYLRDIIHYFKKPSPPFDNTPQLEKDTQSLVDKLKPHKLAKDDPLHPENYTYSLLMQLKSDHTPSFALIDAVAHVIVPMIEQERFLEVPVPKPTDDIVEQAKYRDELRAVINKHRNFVETKHAFDDAIIESMNAFIKALPPAAFGTEGNTTIALEDLIEKPQKLLWDIISPFYDNAAHERNLFKSLTDQIDENVRKQKDVLPQDAEGTTTELFNKYLYDTPLRKITDAQIPFEIPDRFLPEHRLVVASTGTGKSQFIQQDVYHYLQREERPGIVIIDSQGTMLPKFERLNLWHDDLVIIDPEDICPPALNMFALPERIKSYDRNKQEIIESTTIQLFGFLFAALDQSLTGRQSTFFSFVTRLVLSIPGATLRTLREVLEEEPKTPEQSHFWPYVQKLDPDAQAFFKNQFYQKGYNVETKRGIVQRLYGILRVPAFNRMFTARENRLDLFEELNAGKTILINTSKALLGEDASSVFARYAIAQTLSAVFQRVAIKPPYRLALLYCDEAAEVMKDETLSTLFTQARKYELGALIAFQNLQQMPAGLAPVVLANTTTKLVAGLTDRDARALATDMRTTPDFLLSLRKHKSASEFGCFIKNYTPAAVRLTIPFGVIEDAPKMTKEEHKALRQKNRERYGTSSSANVNHENSLSQTHEAPAKKASNEVPRPHPTPVSTTPPPAPNPAADPHAGIDD